MPSSVIAAMRYEPEDQTLAIVYRGGRGTYRYFSVPLEEWEAFRAAVSKGTYLNEIFKKKGYRYEKVAGASRFTIAKPANYHDVTSRKPSESSRLEREEHASGRNNWER